MAEVAEAPAKERNVQVHSSDKGSQPSTPPVRPGRHPLLHLRTELDRMFDNFASSFGWQQPMLFPKVAGWTMPEPRRVSVDVDVSENEDRFEIAAELPGLDEKDIEVTVSGDALTIRGEKQEEREEKQKDYVVSERRYGSFQRSFGIPSGVDHEKISADFSKGVLKLTLPKTPEAQRQNRKIEIKAS